MPVFRPPSLVPFRPRRHFTASKTAPIVLVQAVSAEASATNSLTLTFASPVAAGSLIVVAVRCGVSGDPDFSGCTDTAGNAYAQGIEQLNAGSVRTTFYHAVAGSAGPLSVTVTTTTGADLHAIASEFSGVQTLGPQNSADADGVTSLAAGDVTTTPANALLLTALAASDPETITAPAGYTEAIAATSLLGVAYRVVSSPGTYGATWTTTTGDVAAVHAAFYPAIEAPADGPAAGLLGPRLVTPRPSPRSRASSRGRTTLVRPAAPEIGIGPAPHPIPRLYLARRPPRLLAGGRNQVVRPAPSEDIVPPAPPDAPHPAPRMVLATRPRFTPGRVDFLRAPFPPTEMPARPPVSRVTQPRPVRRHRATRPRFLRSVPPLPGVLAVTARADGLYRVSDASLVAYLLYRGVGASPDLTAAAYETFAALPHTTANQAAGATYRFVLRQRNAYGLISQNVAETVLELDGSGDEVVTRPSDPFFVEANPGAAGVVTVTAKYAYDADGDNQADAFLVYARTDGTNPDVTIDTPIEISMAKADGVARLSHSTAALLEGAVAKFIVRTRRNGSPDVDSTSTTIVTATATLLGPAAVSPASAFLGRSAEQAQ